MIKYTVNTKLIMTLTCPFFFIVVLVLDVLVLVKGTGGGGKGVNCDQTLRGQGRGTLECDQLLAENELVELSVIKLCFSNGESRQHTILVTF